MLFEGSEKKLEVVVSAQAGSLKALGEDFWRQVVQSSGAQILSRISRAECDAYLLSESSLFVWDNKFTMITCGRTTLTAAVQEFVKKVSTEHIDALVFERKNEYYPRWQRSDFFSDADELHRVMPGLAYRFGHAGEHHIYLFHSEKPFKPTRGDVTTELLMYHIGAPALEVFAVPGQTEEKIRQYLQLETIFPGYAWDDHVFEPSGYSINGIKGKRYVTIHVTPQDGGSYVSFETNADFGESLPLVLAHVVGRFHPLTFDVMTFRPDDKNLVFEAQDYWRVNRVEHRLQCGYRVCYSSHYLTNAATQDAHVLDV